MAHRVLDSVVQIATGTGTGNLALGAASGGKYKTLQNAGLADGDSTYARIQHSTIDSEWEDVLITRSGTNIVRTFDDKSSSATGSLISFSTGDKYVSCVLLSQQVVTRDDAGNVTIDGDLTVSGSIVNNAADFATAVQAAWDADEVLNWNGGNLTLTEPIVLEFNTTWKFNFGIRFNGAKVSCDFNDATKYAITIQAHDTGGEVFVTNVGARGFQIIEGSFSATTPYAGAIELKCKTNQSWIASFLYRDLTVSGHSDYAFRFTGSVFEFVLERLITENGKGALYIQQIGTGAGGTTDQGLPSAMYCYTPDFRDFSEHAIVLKGVQDFNDPFDLTVVDGYIVTGGGKGIVAPSGITRVEGVGFEFLGQTDGLGGSAMDIGYRGGVFKNCRGANAVASADLGSASEGLGIAYLINLGIGGNTAVIEDCVMQNEGSGSGPAKLANIWGNGNKVYLNRVGATEDAVDNPGGCPIVNTTP